MKIGEKLRVFANKKLGSVAKLAESLGMKPPSLYNYLDGVSIPGGEMLAKLKNLGCDINWLLSEDEKEMPKNDSIETAIKEMDEVQLSLIKAAINSGNDEAIKAAVRMILIKIDNIEKQRNINVVKEGAVSLVADNKEKYNQGMSLSTESE